MRKLTTSATWVSGIAELLTAEGLDACALLAAAGIDRETLEAPGGRVPTEKISLLWDLATERSGNPAIGLAQHDVVRPANFDVVGYTMMSCTTLLDGFERLNRYLHILSDTLTITLSEEQERFRVAFELFGGDRPTPRQRIEYIMVSLSNFCRWVSGCDIHPQAIELPYPAPPDLAPYRAAFRCPVIFGAPRSSLLFALSDLTKPLPTSNPVLAELHERFAGEYLRHFGDARISSRAREMIICLLPDGEPRRDEIACELGMSERTLQRRLSDEGTSFRRLLDDTRRTLAEQYLGRLHLSLAQAAYLLGFADQSSFFRACRRWFELSPMQYRSQLLGRQANRSGGSQCSEPDG